MVPVSDVTAGLPGQQPVSFEEAADKARIGALVQKAVG